MANQINVPVRDIVDNLLQAYKLNKGMNDCIYFDETWNLQVTLLGRDLRFRAVYNYKNGESGQNYIHVNVNGQITESNPEVKVRKDLLEKMESITKAFYSERGKNISELAIPALIRHYDDLGDEIASMPIQNMQTLGDNFVYADISAGKLNPETTHEDSSRVVVERRIRAGFLNIMEEVLKQMKENNIKLPNNIKNKLMQDLIDAKFDGQKLLMAVVKNLKYLVDESMTASHVVDSSQFRFYLNTIYGFVVYNKSNKPIQFDKLDYKTGAKIGVGLIMPCNSVSMSKAEIAMLSSQPTINCKLNNATLRLPSRKTSSKLEWRNSIMIITKDETENAKVRYKDITQVPFDQWDRFIDGANLIGTVDRILKLAYYSDDAGDISFRKLCETFVKYCGMDVLEVTELITKGLVTTVISKLGIKNIEVSTSRNAETNTVNVDIRRVPRKDKSVFSLFKR